MKRLISLLLSVLMMLTTVINPSVVALAAGCSHSNQSIWYDEPYYEEYDENKHYKYEDCESYCLDCGKVFNKWTETSKKSHKIRDGECIYCGYEEEECAHKKTKDVKVDSWYEQYNDTKHWHIECYETICTNCEEVLDEYVDENKKPHSFQGSMCTKCGYEDEVEVEEICTHPQTKRELSYWDLELRYYEYDIICTVCGYKLRTESEWGKSNDESVVEECTHKRKTVAKNSYYTQNNSETHYLHTEYEDRCTKCDEILESYTNKVTEKHTISNNVCTKCGYTKKITTNNSSSSFTDSNIFNSSNNSSSSSSTQKPVNNNNVTSSKKEEIERIFIDIEKSKFAVDDKAVTWKAKPILDPNGNIQVPLRQIAEIMGWKVTWNAKNKQAIVTDGEITKTFMQGNAIYCVKDAKGNHYKNLQNRVQNVKGTLYVDLDGVLDSTGYSYYVVQTDHYLIVPRDEAISVVATSTVTGNRNIVGSKTILTDPQYDLEVQQNEMLFMVIENDDGTRSFAAFVPAAEQALQGNYYKGEVTWQGVIGEIIVGELPGVGTAADVRDVAADFQNWEWSWAHAGQTTVDLIGCIPLIGCLKYTDEVATLLKKSGKVADASVTKTAQKFMDKSASYDELAATTSKTLNDYLKAAKAAIKNADDLKALAKNPDIYANDVLEHIFYGNKAGGFHYKGLSGANGTIDKIISKPNKYGVYQAEVTILGKKKPRPNSFFPDNWTPKQVLDTIDEAYYNGNYNASRNIIEYTNEVGMKLQINLNDNGQIVSAFPIY